MGWYYLEKNKTVKLTRALAHEWAAMPSVSHDRPLQQWRLELHNAALKNGMFRAPIWSKCLCEEDRETYRINGKHTSTLLAGYEPLPEMSVTLESYGCNTHEDLARLYSTFDTRVPIRTTGDVNQVFAGANPDLVNIPKRIINLLASGIGFSVWGNTSRTKLPDARAALLLENVEFCVWVDSVLPGIGTASNKLSRSPVVAAIYVTWCKSKKDAAVFWTAVDTESGESPTLADRILAKWLNMNSINYGEGTKHPISRRATPNEFFVRCIHAWNAWRKGTPTSLRYLPGKEFPRAL